MLQHALHLIHNFTEQTEERSVEKLGETAFKPIIRRFAEKEQKMSASVSHGKNKKGPPFGRPLQSLTNHKQMTGKVKALTRK